MKIAVSTSEGGLKDNICPVFGRCPSFTIVDAEGKEAKKAGVVPNPGSSAGGGAGIAAAQAVIDNGSKAVITGSCGPNALAVLQQAGVKVYSASGSVEDAVKALLEGKLSEISSPSAPPHFGMGFGRGGGPGGGRGFGRGGPGGGRGLGRGRP